MRGDFDVNKGCYPYGYLRQGNFINETPAYRVTDMRTLEPISNVLLPGEQAVLASERINTAHRQGHGYERFEDFVAATIQEVQGFNGPVRTLGR